MLFIASLARTHAARRPHVLKRRGEEHGGGRRSAGTLRRADLVGAALLAALCTPAALGAQDRPAAISAPPADSWHLGPVVVAPALTLSNVGWDSNVFHRREDAEPVSDFTATVRPQIQSWLRLGRARVKGQNALDVVYFQEHPNERSVDADHEGRVDVPLARVTPYASVRWASARQRFGFEIDDRLRRTSGRYVVGVDVQVGARTNLDISARRSRLEFDATAASPDSFVSNFYDHTSRGLALSLRQRLTPLTSVAVTVSSHRDRFDLVPWRDSNSVGIASSVEFRPSALITGNASIGWRRVELLRRDGRPFSGLVSSADLGYTLLGTTRFAVQVQRDMSYSALRGQHAFLLSGARASMTHYLGGGWDASIRTGRYRVTYGLFGPAGEASVAPLAGNPYRETVTEYGGDIGYRAGPGLRVAFDVSRVHRHSAVAAAREYVRMRTAMSVTYRF